MENVDLIIQYTNNIAYEEFINNAMLVDAAMFRLVQIAENIKELSKEFKNIHSSIPWGQIIGFRNGIVHDYIKTDYLIVYEIISKDIYDLKEEFNKGIN